jgi:hypothetical protein
MAPLQKIKDELPKVSLHVTEVNQQKQFFSYRGETYSIQVIRKGVIQEGAGLHEDVTSLRDWTEAGVKTLDAVETVFKSVAKTDEFEKLQTLHIGLNGNIATSSNDRFDPKKIKLAKVIWYSDSITETPSSYLKFEKSDDLRQKIAELGTELAQWKTPRRVEERQPLVSPPKQSHEEIPPKPEKEELPPLSLNHPTNKSSEEFFLRGIGKPLKGIKENPGSIIAEQLKQLENPLSSSAEEFLKEFKRYFISDIFDSGNNPYALTQRDVQEVFAYMSEHFNPLSSIPKEFTTREADRFNALLNERIAPTEKEGKKLLMKAFSLCCCNKTLPGQVPSAYYQAIYALVNRVPKKDWKSFISTSYDYSQDVKSGTEIILLNEKGGKYEIERRWPQQGDIHPSRAIFILKTPEGYKGFNRALLNQSPLASISPSAQLRQVKDKPGYLSDALFYDVGAGGDCGAKALTAAILERDGVYYASAEELKAAIEEKNGMVRRETLAYMFEHPEAFIDEKHEELIATALRENRGRGLLSGIDDEKIKRTIGVLIDKDERSENEKKWMVQLYAKLCSNQGVWLDSPFFLAYALKSGRSIALISGNQIVRVPVSEGLIAKDDLFVSYTASSSHYQAVSQNHAELKQYIDRYNAQKLRLAEQTKFLKALDRASSSPETISAEEMKEVASQFYKNDLHGLLVINRLIGNNAFKRLAETGDSQEFLRDLLDAIAIAEGSADVDLSDLPISERLSRHIARCTDLKASAEFYMAYSKKYRKKYRDVDNTQDLLNTLRELQRLFKQGYQVLEQFFKKTLSPEELEREIEGCNDKKAMLDCFMQAVENPNVQ